MTTTSKRKPRLSTAPIAHWDDGRYVRDRRRRRRKDAPEGVCADCWRERRSDDKPGEMYIGDDWKGPSCMCKECAEDCARFQREARGKTLRCWPIGIVRDTAAKGEGPDRGIYQQSAIAGRSRLIAFDRSGEVVAEFTIPRGDRPPNFRETLDEWLDFWDPVRELRLEPDPAA